MSVPWRSDELRRIETVLRSATTIAAAVAGVQAIRKGTTHKALEHLCKSKFGETLQRRIYANVNGGGVAAAAVAEHEPTANEPAPEIEIPITFEDAPRPVPPYHAPAPSFVAPPPPSISAEPPPPPTPQEVIEQLEKERTTRAQKLSDREKLKHVLEELRLARMRQSWIEEVQSLRAAPVIYARGADRGVREMTAVALASDWHVEEPVYPESIAGKNEYNLAIADERVRKFFRSLIWTIEHHRASGRIVIRNLVLWLGGDLISGYIHQELVESNLLSPSETVRWLIVRLRNGIATLLEYLGLDHLEIVCSHGNHGRTTLKSMISTGAENSFEWLMYCSLADEFRNDPRVHFEITQSRHQYVEVYGRTIHFHHGDELKYQGGVGGLGIPLKKRIPAWDRIRESDVHCIGHWHQLTDFGRSVVNGSLIGYNAFAQSIGADPEPPQQAFFLMDSERGKCMTSALWVDRVGSELLAA